MKSVIDKLNVRKDDTQKSIDELQKQLSKVEAASKNIRENLLKFQIQYSAIELAIDEINKASGEDTDEHS